jgi:hypothetical protein
LTGLGLGVQQHGGRLRARPDSELREGRCEVALDGALRQTQRVGSLSVRRPVDHEAKHLLLAVREGPLLDVVSMLARQRQLSGQRGTQRWRQRALNVRLEHQPVHSCVQCAADVVVPGRVSNDHDPRVRQRFVDAPERADGFTILVQVKLDDDSVWLAVAAPLDERLGTRASRGEPKLVLEERRNGPTRRCGAHHDGETWLCTAVRLDRRATH